MQLLLARFSNLIKLHLIVLGLLTAYFPLNAIAARMPNVTETSNSPNTNLTTWEIHGALAAKNKSKGWSASLNWLQFGPNTYQIRLMGPLGSGSVLISKKDNLISFKDGRTITTSNNAEDLLLKQTGIRLPVKNLYYWVRGLAAPGSVQAKILDKTRHLQRLQQNGYTIDFLQYNNIMGFLLPTIIRLEGNGLLVKVNINRWTLRA
ncbi:MAG: outer membrane lipoprotein LolB [Legionella sp.]|nr:outer membrane lipoprotein LolB [Legionella sp.]